MILLFLLFSSKRLVLFFYFFFVLFFSGNLMPFISILTWTFQLSLISQFSLLAPCHPSPSHTTYPPTPLLFLRFFSSLKTGWLLKPGRKSQVHFCFDKSFWWKWKWFQCVTSSPSKEAGWKTEMIVHDNGAAFFFFLSLCHSANVCQNSEMKRRRKQILIKRTKMPSLFWILIH